MQSSLAIQPANSIFRYLPHDLIKYIIRLCEDKDIQALAKTSKTFNKMIDELFIGKALRFKYWQKKELANLTRDITQLMNDRRDNSTSTLIAQMDDSNTNSHRMMKISQILMKIAALFIGYGVVNNLYEYIVNGKQTNLYIAGMELLLTAILLIAQHYINKEMDQNRQLLINSHRNLGYLIANTVNENNTQLMIDQIVARHQSLLNAVNSLPLSFEEQTSLLVANIHLQSNIGEISYLAFLLNAYLDIKRFSLKSHFDINEFAQFAESYLLNTVNNPDTIVDI